MGKWLAGLLLVFAACSGCAASFTPALIRADNLPPGKAAVMLCSENNVPYMAVSPFSESVLLDLSYAVHEDVHAKDAYNYRGGCKGFVRRYVADSAFRRKVEWRAYCKQGHWLIEHGAQPDSVWSYLKDSMTRSHGAKITYNCLFDEGK